MDVEEVVDYLFIQRHNPVSLADIERGTDVPRDSILSVMEQLISEGVVTLEEDGSYQLDPENGNTQERYADYRRDVGDGLEKAWKRAR